MTKIEPTYHFCLSGIARIWYLFFGVSQNNQVFTERSNAAYEIICLEHAIDLYITCWQAAAVGLWPHFDSTNFHAVCPANQQLIRILKDETATIKIRSRASSTRVRNGISIDLIL
jgi:hypothetical protein